MDMSEEDTFLFGMELVTGSFFASALRTAIELDLLELITKSPSGSVSSSDLAAQLPATHSGAARMIDRMLFLLTAHGVLICDAAGIERRYSPAPVCKFLTKNEHGVSLASISALAHDAVIVNTWPYLKDAVLGGGEAFSRAYGMEAFEYTAVDERFNRVFNEAMIGHSTLVMDRLLQIYDGFEGLKSVVDVGGGIGLTLKMIVDQHPSIRGINFDLPHVIRQAPPYSGIEHVSGDMFVSVPKADAIFMKWICHDWSDDHCRKLLKNCYEALGDAGKLIIAESIMVHEPKPGLQFKRVASMDVMMMTKNPGGKERTEIEFRSLAQHAGFNNFTKVCYAYGIWIMELYK